MTVRPARPPHNAAGDAIVLDQMLPKMSGLEVLRVIRAAGVMTPVVLLTAMGSVQDRVTGLNAGADDYIPKPFDFAELLARLNAVVRRTSVRPTPVLTVNDLNLDLSTRRVSRDGRDVDLTPIEFSLLELLMRFAGQVVTRKCCASTSGDSTGTERPMSLKYTSTGFAENSTRDGRIPSSKRYAVAAIQSPPTRLRRRKSELLTFDGSRSVNLRPSETYRELR